MVDGDLVIFEGIFVYDGGNGSDVKFGDCVWVIGQVCEFNGFIELVGLLQVSVLVSGVVLLMLVGISLLLVSVDVLECYEGMCVQFCQMLIVNEVYNFGCYGEVLLFFGGCQMILINVVVFGEQVKVMQVCNDFDWIFFDDGCSGQNFDLICYLVLELSVYNSLCVGDCISVIDGVFDYLVGSYCIQLLQMLIFEVVNLCLVQLVVEGCLWVVSFNVFNYFNGDGKGGGFFILCGVNMVEEF